MATTIQSTIKRGRPLGSKNITKIQCIACLQKFHPTKLNKYEAHFSTSPACKKFMVIEEPPPVLTKPIHQHIIDTLDMISGSTSCRFCEQPITDIKEHMKESYVCNRMTYQEFKKKI